MQTVRETLQSKHPRQNKPAMIMTILLMALWLSLVVFTMAHHEFWRDEIRALSLAQSAQNPIDLFQHIRYEGHPFLWYFLLYFSYLIFQTKLVLPILSIVIAFSAIVIFMLKSPFPLWGKTLFIFSAIPLYEYAVMARNYGISMLLLFLIAALYSKKEKHTYLLAVLIALLANTNVHSLILSALIIFIWIWELVQKKTYQSLKTILRFFTVPMIIVTAGFALCILVVFPKENSILVQSNNTLSSTVLVEGLKTAIFRPDVNFSSLWPANFPSILIMVLLFLILLGLIQQPQLFLAGLGAQTVIGLTFQVVYSGSFRHQGLYYIFIVFLYWLYWAAKPKTGNSIWLKSLSSIGMTAAVIGLMGNLLLFKHTTLQDITTPASASKQFAHFLTSSSNYENAILLPEPDFMLESLPYYSNHQIFFVRENQFGKTVAWKENAQRNLTMGTLLRTAQTLHTTTGQPILIILGHWDADFIQPGLEIYSYNKVFSWEDEDIQLFKETTKFLVEFSPAFTGEKYRVYEYIPGN